MLTIALFFDPQTAVHYVSQNMDFTEAMFVVFDVRDLRVVQITAERL
jgi:hypothetical protein